MRDREIEDLVFEIEPRDDNKVLLTASSDINDCISHAWIVDKEIREQGIAYLQEIMAITRQQMIDYISVKRDKANAT